MITGDAGSFVVPAHSAISEGGDVRIAVRPEWLDLWRPGCLPRGENGLPATVQDLVYLGETIHVLVTLANGRVMIVALRNEGQLIKPLPWNRGDSCIVAWRPEDCQVLEGVRDMRRGILRWLARHPRSPGALLLGPGGLWLLAFFLLPILILLVYSVMPRGAYGGVEPGFTLEHYRRFLDPLYLAILRRTIWLLLPVHPRLPPARHTRWRSSSRGAAAGGTCCCSSWSCRSGPASWCARSP